MVPAACGLTNSDADLVARVRAGDEGAFAQLYGRYSDRIRRFVATMVSDAGRAEDVTQEVFVAALRRLRETERPVTFKPWVYEIARNASIDEFRRARRMRETAPRQDAEWERSGRDALFGAVPGPERAAETRETLADLTAAFAGLPAAQRRVLVLRELEGRTYAEMGALCGMSRAAVESALFRARRRLAEEYGELESGRRCATVRGSLGGPLSPRAQELAARHLASCAGCRRHAALLSLEPIPSPPPSRRARLAALVPLPVVGLLRRLGELVAGGGESVAAWGKAAAAVVLVTGGATVGGGHLLPADPSPVPGATRGSGPAVPLALAAWMPAARAVQAPPGRVSARSERASVRGAAEPGRADRSGAGAAGGGAADAGRHGAGGDGRGAAGGDGGGTAGARPGGENGAGSSAPGSVATGRAVGNGSRPAPVVPGVPVATAAPGSGAAIGGGADTASAGGPATGAGATGGAGGVASAAPGDIDAAAVAADPSDGAAVTDAAAAPASAATGLSL